MFPYNTGSYIRIENLIEAAAKSDDFEPSRIRTTYSGNRHQEAVKPGLRVGTSGQLQATMRNKSYGEGG